MAEETKPAVGNGAPAGAPVAQVQPQSQPGANPRPVHAGASVPVYGGNRGGRKRTDGLAPGSPEAKEADRVKDAQRKRESRQPAQPAALPAASQGLAGASSPAGTAQGSNSAVEISQPEILWRPEDLAEVVTEAIELSERASIKNNADLAQRAGLAADLVKQIAKDSQYVPAFKAVLLRASPKALAKTLNRIGISAAYSDETLSALAIGAIFVQQWRNRSNLEDLIESKQQKDKENADKARAISQGTEAPGQPIGKV